LLNFNFAMGGQALVHESISIYCTADAVTSGAFAAGLDARAALHDCLLFFPILQPFATWLWIICGMG
jgi:hypothetical protein